MGKYEVVKTFNNIETGTKRATVRALNRAVKSAFSNTSKFIRETYNIKKEDLEKFAKIIPASLTNMVAKLIVNRKAVGLYKYKARQNRLGVTASQRKGEKKLYRHAFIASMKAGETGTHTGVFIRTGVKKIATKGRYEGKMREQIKELFGASPYNLFKDEIAQKFLQEKFVERFNIEFSRQIEYESSRVLSK